MSKEMTTRVITISHADTTTTAGNNVTQNLILQMNYYFLSDENHDDHQLLDSVTLDSALTLDSATGVG
jgi:hypothetical protein